MRIALYQGTSFISRLIRWQTRSQYSHAAFLFDEGTVVEAWQPVVREIEGEYIRNRYEFTRFRPKLSGEKYPALSLQHTPGTKVDIFEFICPLTKEENGKLEYLARRDVGIPYDYRSIFRFLTRERSKLYRHSLFCSEQVFSRCDQAGRALLDRTESWRVPPDWIARSPHLKLGESIVTV